MSRINQNSQRVNHIKVIEYREMFSKMKSNKLYKQKTEETRFYTKAIKIFKILKINKEVIILRKIMILFWKINIQHRNH